MRENQRNKNSSCLGLRPKPRDLPLSGQDSWIRRASRPALSESWPLSRRSGRIPALPYPPLRCAPFNRTTTEPWRLFAISFALRYNLGSF